MNKYLEAETDNLKKDWQNLILIPSYRQISRIKIKNRKNFYYIVKYNFFANPNEIRYTQLDFQKGNLDTGLHATDDRQ